MSEYFIVDRIEGENIIIESPKGEMITISKNSISSEIRESDVLIKEGNIFVVDYKETENRKSRIRNIVEGMWSE